MPTGTICVSYISKKRAGDKATWASNRAMCQNLGPYFDLVTLADTATINALGSSGIISDSIASVGFNYDGNNWVDSRTGDPNALLQSSTSWNKDAWKIYKPDSVDARLGAVNVLKEKKRVTAGQGGALHKESPYLLDYDDGKIGAICQCLSKFSQYMATTFASCVYEY